MIFRRVPPLFLILSVRLSLTANRFFLQISYITRLFKFLEVAMQNIMYGHVIFTTCSQHVHDMFTTCSRHVHDMLTTCSRNVSNMFSSPHVHIMLTTCSRLITIYAPMDDDRSCLFKNSFPCGGESFTYWVSFYYCFLLKLFWFFVKTSFSWWWWEFCLWVLVLLYSQGYIFTNIKNFGGIIWWRE